MNSMTKTPAQDLEGMTLPCGWTVDRYIPKEDGQTGGNFSIGYIVKKNEKKAFLKALDFKKLMGARGLSSPMSAMQVMTSSFNYEKDILEQCNNAGMSKVVRSFSAGEIVKNDFLVPYIVFEIADSDIRKYSIGQAGFDLAWILRTMHHVSVGIKQLHTNGISHQDIKPSNILLVDSIDRKIGDFGTCVTVGCDLPHAELDIAGDQTYAPPEALYGYKDHDWLIRRYSVDAYQLGSLMVYMIIGVPASALLLSNLRESFHPRRWGGTYYDVLPYLDDAFAASMNAVSRHLPDNSEKAEIIKVINELCEPSVFLRGDPVNRRKSNPYNMERYISRFDRLAKRFEYNLFKVN